MSNVQLGQAVPNFQLPSTGDTIFNLSDYKGKNVVIYFYPKDSTPGCTLEGQNFRDNIAEFEAHNTIIVGVSRDSIRKHENFKAKQEFPFELLSDEEESWSMDDSYRLYKMFESLPFNPFGEGNEVNFETGENVTGIFTLSNDILDRDLELSTVDNIKIARVGKDAFTYASPQIVTVDGIKGKFYSKRLYKAIVNFITDFGSTLIFIPLSSNIVSSELVSSANSMPYANPEQPVVVTFTLMPTPEPLDFKKLFTLLAPSSVIVSIYFFLSYFVWIISI